MVAVRPLARPRRWPVWLLFAAWLCANGPQSACFDLVLWLKGAGHFSHSQRLTVEARAALRGEIFEHAPARWAAAPDRPVAPVEIPAEATIKKIELIAPDRRELPGVAGTGAGFECEQRQLPAARFVEVPHPPPRSRV